MEAKKILVGTRDLGFQSYYIHKVVTRLERTYILDKEKDPGRPPYLEAFYINTSSVFELYPHRSEQIRRAQPIAAQQQSKPPIFISAAPNHPNRSDHNAAKPATSAPVYRRTLICKVPHSA